MKAGVMVDKAVAGETRTTNNDKKMEAIRAAVETEATVGTIAEVGVVAATIGRETTSTTNTTGHQCHSRSAGAEVADEVGAKTVATGKELSTGVTAKTIRGSRSTSMLTIRRKIHLQDMITPTTTATENKKAQAKIREEARVVEEEEGTQIVIIKTRGKMGRRQDREAAVVEGVATKEHIAVARAEDATETRMAERIKPLKRQGTKEIKTEEDDSVDETKSKLSHV